MIVKRVVQLVYRLLLFQFRLSIDYFRLSTVVVEITLRLDSIRVKTTVIFEAFVTGLEFVIKLALTVPLANQE